MNYSQLQNQISAIERRAAKEIKKLKQEYAFQFNKVQLGDIVSNGKHFITVSDMGVSEGLFGNKIPQMEYKGVLLGSGGLPRKDGAEFSIVLADIKTVNGVSISEL